MMNSLGDLIGGAHQRLKQNLSGTRALDMKLYLNMSALNIFE